MVTSGEKTFLIEFLVLISNLSSSKEERQNFLSNIVEPLLLELESCSFFLSTENFLDVCGIKLLANFGIPFFFSSFFLKTKFINNIIPFEAEELKRNPNHQISQENTPLRSTSFNRRHMYFLVNTFLVTLKRVNHAEETKAIFFFKTRWKK